MPRLPEFNGTALENITVTVDDMLKALSEVNKKSAVGPDGVHNLALFNTRHYIAGVLTYIFNQCLSQCLMPNFWKVADIIPIHNIVVQRSVPQIIGLISLISCTSKVLERLVHNSIMSFLNISK